MVVNRDYPSQQNSSHVRVSKEVKQDLFDLKESLGLNSVSAVIEKLIDQMEDQ